eukprot:3940269-Pleurochrysis_carterae.AAC.1
MPREKRGAKAAGAAHGSRPRTRKAARTQTFRSVPAMLRDVWTRPNRKKVGIKSKRGGNRKGCDSCGRNHRRRRTGPPVPRRTE